MYIEREKCSTKQHTTIIDKRKYCKTICIVKVLMQLWLLVMEIFAKNPVYFENTEEENVFSPISVLKNYVYILKNITIILYNEIFSSSPLGPFAPNLEQSCNTR